MARDEALNIMARLGAQPAVAFYESGVASAIEEILSEMPLPFRIDEFGNIIASREEGPLLLIRDMDRDGIAETVTTYCDEVKSCQGILAMNGQVLVTADGPKGSGLYRLSDDDRNGVIDHIRLVLAFKGSFGRDL